MTTATTFIAGASGALAAVAALLFLRFWRMSGDRLFGLFALAFAVIAGNRIAITVIPREQDTWIYTLRLVAFAVIIVAIVDKNRPRRSP
jgi:uncharacterized protein DUF5985